VTFDEFDAAAHRAWDEIPEHFKEGIDGLHVSAEAPTHPDMPEIYTFGECLTEAWPSDWQGPDTTRSLVVLYHGSFAASAAEGRDLDWDAEIWETLTHELRHHLESLAGEGGLEGVDYAMDEGFKRAAGEDFDPLYYQAGDHLGEGLYRVEDQFFLERVEAMEWSGEVRFEWDGVAMKVQVPGDRADVHYFWLDGIDAGPGGIELVMVRKRGWLETLREALTGWRPTLDVGDLVAVPDRP
jgi:hypothetical protein